MSRLAAPRHLALAAGIVGLAAWIALAFAAPAAAGQGWQIAFVFWSGPALGALALALIRRLTAGRWGEAFAPEIEPAARTAPLLVLFALPTALLLPAVFGWAAAPGAVDGEVRAAWLNTPMFLARNLVLLAGWSLIAFRLGAIERAGPRGRLAAGLALGFHGVAVSVAATDWIGSITPSFVNSAAGMTLGTAQLVAALAWCALQGEARAARAPSGDVAGLLFATSLGLVYLVFMAWLVAWYGDRPSPNVWWLPRARAPWGWLAGGAFALGFLAPTAILLCRRVLGLRRGLRAAGGCAAAGLLLYTTWLFAPTYGPGCLAPGLAALLAQGGLWLAATLRGGPELAEAQAHG